MDLMVVIEDLVLLPNASYDSDSSLLMISVSSPYDIYGYTFNQMSGFRSSDRLGELAHDV